MLNAKSMVLKKRLIVLVPNGWSEDASLAEKVYRLALLEHCDVLYLALVEDFDTRLPALRHMATLSALTSSDAVMVKSVLIQSTGWIEKLREYVRPGDRLVCLAGQTVNMGWLTAVPVHEVLEKTLDAPVTVLPGIYHPWKTASRKWLYSLLFWAGCLAILAGFSVLEFQIDHVLQGVLRTALISIALVVEFGAFWAWNHVPRM